MSKRSSSIISLLFLGVITCTVLSYIASPLRVIPVPASAAMSIADDSPVLTRPPTTDSGVGHERDPSAALPEEANTRPVRIVTGEPLREDELDDHETVIDLLRPKAPNTPAAGTTLPDWDALDDDDATQAWLLRSRVASRVDARPQRPEWESYARERSSVPPETGLYPPVSADDDEPVLSAPPGAPVTETDEAELTELDIVEEHALVRLDDRRAEAPTAADGLAWATVDVDIAPTDLDRVDPEDRAALDAVMDTIALAEAEASGPRPDRRRNETPILLPELPTSEPLPSAERGAAVARAIEAGASALKRASQPTPAGTVHVVPELSEDAELEPLDGRNVRAMPGVVSSSPTRPVEISPTAFHPEADREVARESAAAHRLQPRRLAGYEHVDLHDDAGSSTAAKAPAVSKLQLLSLPDMEVWLSAVDTLDATAAPDPLTMEAPALLGAPMRTDAAPARTASPPPLPAIQQRIAPTTRPAPTTESLARVASLDATDDAPSLRRSRLVPIAAPVALLTLPTWLAAASAFGWSAALMAVTGVLAWSVLVTAGGAMVGVPGAAWTNRNGLLSLDRAQLVLSTAVVLSAYVGLVWNASSAAAVALPTVPGSIGALVAIYALSAIGAHALVPSGRGRIAASARNLVVRPSVEGGEQLDLAGVMSLLAWLAVLGGCLLAAASTTTLAIPPVSVGLVALVAGIQSWYVATRASLG